MQTLLSAYRSMLKLARRAGPYALLELLLPGGTLLAFALLMYRSGALAALHQSPAIDQDVPQHQILVVA